MKIKLFKRTGIILSAVLFISAICCGFYVFRIKAQVQDLFRMNKTLQQEGYYMADFEFKLMGLVYYLDKGHYARALSTISNFHSQLMNRKNLIKVPRFDNPREEMTFYAGLQNPRTGAFMDDTYPYCTFNEPTENVIAHLEALAEQSGAPLKLKYPLKYLDEISTPENLHTFLNDVSYVGRLGTKFPETTFLFARSLLSFVNKEGVIAKNNLYTFSDDFKTTLMDWFYDHQDEKTGYWGPLSKNNGRLARVDLNNTASIVKTFVDRNGNDRYASYPLKHGDKIFKTTLELLRRPLPARDALDEWHDWSLSTSKGIKMLLRYLWKDASIDDKQAARAVIEDYVTTKFDLFYIPEEGGFSFYPNSGHASLDGTGGFLFKDIGAYSADQQKRLWGAPEKNILELGVHQTSRLKSADIEGIAGRPGVNSLRVYTSAPDYANLTEGVIGLVYPGKTSVMDIMELVPGLTGWLDRQSLSMGNWTSKEQIKEFYGSLKIQKPLILKNMDELDRIDAVFQERSQIVAIAFDILQIPRYKIVYKKTQNL